MRPAEPDGRQPPQVDGEDQDQDQADPIDRERDPEVGAEGRDAVGPAARSPGAVDADADADDRRKEHGRAGQAERRGKALEQVAAGWGAG